MAHEKHYKPGCKECIAERRAEREASGLPNLPKNKALAAPQPVDTALIMTGNAPRSKSEAKRVAIQKEDK